MVKGIPSAVLIYGIVTFCSIKKPFVQNDFLVFGMLVDTDEETIRLELVNGISILRFKER